METPKSRPTQQSKKQKKKWTHETHSGAEACMSRVQPLTTRALRQKASNTTCRAKGFREKHAQGQQLDTR